MEEEMYSLPYKEALAQHRKKYGNNVPFMSKDQYELKQAQIEKQKKMSASADKPNWWEQEGPSDEIIAKNGNVTAADIAERRLTPKQQGIQAKGNDGDNKLENPDKLDTADITKLDKELNKTVGQKDSYTPEERAEAAKNTGITKEVPGTTSANETITDSVSEAVTPKEGDTKEESAAKGQYNKSMMSIWDAYRNGDIDKETAGYFTIDAIATLAKNLGRSIGNVGAQFSGGTIDNGHDDSAWEQRKNALLNEEIQKEKEGIGSAASRQAESEELDIAAKKIRNAYTPKQLENQMEMFKRELEMADINLDMAHSKTDLINFIKSDPDYAKSPFKMGLVAYLTQSGTAGAVNTASSTLSDAVNWMLTLFK